MDENKSYGVVSDPDNRKIELVFDCRRTKYDDWIQKAGNDRSITYEELVENLPDDITDKEQIEDIAQMLIDMGIDIIRQ